jgi:NAD(P)-dependent dehydrogenase (short-subunit alcohol dehydrogenase family)
MRPIAEMSVIITGGGSGIGAGAARYLVERGARVTICGRRGDKLRAVAEELGASCSWLQADVTIAEQRKRVIEAGVAHGGGIDVLVNGAANMYRGPLATLDEDRLLDVFRGNVVAAMMLTGAALPHLVERQGCVILFGSVHTQRAFPGASPYAASKGALEALTGVLASELGPQGVRVSCIRPGAVLTEINQRAGLFDEETARQRIEDLGSAHVLGRPGTIEEIAEAIGYLAGAEWTTGAVLTVDGGLGLGTTNA